MKVKVPGKASEKSCSWCRGFNNGSGSPGGEEGKRHPNKEKMLCAGMGGTRVVSPWRTLVVMAWGEDEGLMGEDKATEVGPNWEGYWAPLGLWECTFSFSFL